MEKKKVRGDYFVEVAEYGGDWAWKATHRKTGKRHDGRFVDKPWKAELALEKWCNRQPSTLSATPQADREG